MLLSFLAHSRASSRWFIHSSVARMGVSQSAARRDCDLIRYLPQTHKYTSSLTFRVTLSMFRARLQSSLLPQILAQWHSKVWVHAGRICPFVYIRARRKEVLKIASETNSTSCMIGRTRGVMSSFERINAPS